MHRSALIRGAREGKTPANALSALSHTTKSPVSVRRARVKGFRIEAAAIVATTHRELPPLIIEFDHDARGSRVAKGIQIGRAHV